MKSVCVRTVQARWVDAVSVHTREAATTPVPILYRVQRGSRGCRASIHHRRYLSPPDTQTLVSRLCGLRSPSRPGSTFLKQQSSTPPPAGRGYGRGHAPRMQNLPWRPARSQFSHLTSSNRFGDCGSPKVFRVTPYVLYTYRCGCVFLRRTFEGARATPDAASDTMPVCQSDRQTESPCPGSWSHLVADVPPC